MATAIFDQSSFGVRTPSKTVTLGAQEAPRFLVADDHRFVCEALALMICRHWPQATVAQADSFTAAIALLADAEFDVAVLDFCMPGPRGSAAIAEIRDRYPELKIVVVSGLIEPADALRALNMGAVAYLPKSVCADSILTVLTLVLKGETYVPRDLIDAVVREPDPPASPWGALSERDTKLLDALGKGHPNKIIAHAMGVSESTVKLYLHKLFQTLGVHNRTEAVARAVQRRSDPLSR